MFYSPSHNVDFVNSYASHIAFTFLLYVLFRNKMSARFHATIFLRFGVSTRAQRLLRWATVWPQWTWAEKLGGPALGAGSPLGPHLTECSLGRGLPLYQVAS